MAVNTRLTLMTAVGVAALSALAGLWIDRADAEPIAGEAPEAAVPAATPEPMVASFVPLAEVPRPAVPQSAIRYPDGGVFPALNGVAVSIDLIWPSGRPYSPIIGKRVEGPPEYLEWYVHADGSHSTTKMMQVTRGGPLQPVGMVRSEAQMAPVLLRPGGEQKGGDR